MEQTGVGEFHGNTQLIDAETGEVMVMKEHDYQRCHIVYAGYKSIQMVLKDAGDLGFTTLKLDTNVEPITQEIGGTDNTNTTLKTRLFENAKLQGIESITNKNNSGGIEIENDRIERQDKLTQM